jgi:hypothetical protein
VFFLPRAFVERREVPRYIAVLNVMTRKNMNETYRQYAFERLQSLPLFVTQLVFFEVLKLGVGEELVDSLYNLRTNP